MLDLSNYGFFLALLSLLFTFNMQIKNSLNNFMEVHIISYCSLFFYCIFICTDDEKVMMASLGHVIYILSCNLVEMS